MPARGSSEYLQENSVQACEIGAHVDASCLAERQRRLKLRWRAGRVMVAGSADSGKGPDCLVNLLLHALEGKPFHGIHSNGGTKLNCWLVFKVIFRGYTIVGLVVA